MQEPHWRVYVELQTSSLADDVQLGDVAAGLAADRLMLAASPASASVGSRYSVNTTVTLPASDAKAAQDLATAALQAACTKAGVVTARFSPGASSTANDVQHGGIARVALAGNAHEYPH